MRKLFVPLGLSSSPFSVAPSIGAEIASLVSSGLGILGNIASSVLTNRSNQKINQSSMDWQTSENEKARDFAIDMFNRSNEYNSPSAQKQRLLDAEMNPWLANSQVGAAGSPSVPVSPSGVGSAPSSIPMVQPQVPDLSVTASALIGAENAKSNRLQGLASIYDVMAKRDPAAANDWLNRQMDNLGLNGSVAEDFVASQTSYVQAQERYYNALSEVQEAFGKQEASARINQINMLSRKYLQEIQNLRKEGKLTSEKIKLVARQAASEFQRTLNIKADTQLKLDEHKRLEASYDLFVSGMEYDNAIKRSQSQIAAIDAGNKVSDWIANSKVRAKRESDEGQTRIEQHYEFTPEGNYVIDFFDSFTDALSPVKLHLPK